MKRHRIVSICCLLQTILIVLVIIGAILKVVNLENLEEINMVQEIMSIFLFYAWGIGALLFLQMIINYNKKLLREMINSKFAKWFS